MVIGGRESVDAINGKAMPVYLGLRFEINQPQLWWLSAQALLLAMVLIMFRRRCGLFGLVLLRCVPRM